MSTNSLPEQILVANGYGGKRQPWLAFYLNICDSFILGKLLYPLGQNIYEKNETRRYGTEPQQSVKR